MEQKLWLCERQSMASWNKLAFELHWNRHTHTRKIRNKVPSIIDCFIPNLNFHLIDAGCMCVCLSVCVCLGNKQKKYFPWISICFLIFVCLPQIKAHRNSPWLPQARHHSCFPSQQQQQQKTTQLTKSVFPQNKFSSFTEGKEKSKQQSPTLKLSSSILWEFSISVALQKKEKKVEHFLFEQSIMANGANIHYEELRILVIPKHWIIGMGCVEYSS